MTVMLSALAAQASCYVEDSNEADRQELVDEFNLDCVAMPEVCEISDEYSKCAEYPPDDVPCKWHQCLEFEGQHSRWVGRRECLRDVCGIPFSESCVQQFRVLQLDCYENNCKTEHLKETSHLTQTKLKRL